MEVPLEFHVDIHLSAFALAIMLSGVVVFAQSAGPLIAVDIMSFRRYQVRAYVFDICDQVVAHLGERKTKCRGSEQMRSAYALYLSPARVFAALDSRKYLSGTYILRKRIRVSLWDSTS